jgi:predicted nucleic acid-binding protein
MRLIVDTSVLVGELLRVTGRQRLGDERLELFIAEQTWAEVQVELPRRVSAFARRRGIASQVAEDLIRLCLEAITANVAVVDEAVYSALEDEARRRATRDPQDWPLVATALVLDAAVWTNDNDLHGTGVATWTTESLQGWLDDNPGG